MWISLNRQREILPCFSKEGPSWFPSRSDAVEFVKNEHTWATDVRLENTEDFGVFNVTYQATNERRVLDTIIEESRLYDFVPGCR